MQNLANQQGALAPTDKNKIKSPKSSLQNDDFRFQVINSLQRSLDVNDVLASFYLILQKVVPFAGMDYEFELKKLKHSFGARRAHSCTYNLTYGSQRLGGISFSRAKRFSERELRQVETAIGLLLMPMRNAIMYRDALENSLRDGLTGIGNRAALDLVFNREYSLARRNHQTLSVIVADLDHFKAINDNYGHSVGDLALQNTTLQITEALRQTDQVFRFGGEEFVVILSNTTHEQAMHVAERVRTQVATNPLITAQQSISISVSIGVSSLQSCDSMEALFERADTAMYTAKQFGRNCCVSAELEDAVLEQKSEILNTGTQAS